MTRERLWYMQHGLIKRMQDSQSHQTTSRPLQEQVFLGGSAVRIVTRMRTYIPMEHRTSDHHRFHDRCG